MAKTKLSAIDACHIDQLHNYGVFIPQRIIYMGSENVDSEGGESGTDAHMTSKFIKNLSLLEALDPNEDVHIIMNNPGGDEYQGLAIYDAIAASPCFISIRVLGSAMSMGSIILQAADRRIMSANSTQMIHYGTWGTHDHSKANWSLAKEGQKMDKWMEQLYLSRIQEKIPNFELRHVQKMLNFDTYLSAAKSVELGLADIVEGAYERK